jgi:STE24 endopeptidase
MPKLTLLLIAFLVLYSGRLTFECIVNRLNVRHLRRHVHDIPDVLTGYIDRERLTQITSYTADAETLNLVETMVTRLLLLVFLLSGLLAGFTNMLRGWHLGLVAEGVVFFGVIGLANNLVEVPFDLYGTFVVENRYGFSTQTARLWLADRLKMLALSGVLGGIVLVCLLVLMRYVIATWWFWAWLVVGMFELLLLWLYPTVIAPLFNKFEPIEDTALSAAIVSLMQRLGLQVEGIFRMDAGKRSRHTNAYFTGIGRKKRIVLFDTLLEAHPEDEILAILAHEAGHWKKNHILKQLIRVQFLALCGFIVLYRLIQWPLLYETFGIDPSAAYAGLLLAAILLSPFVVFLQPIENALSRKFERDADDVSVQFVDTGKPLARALIRLVSDNLSNVWPHPVYEWYHYSHPSPVTRIKRLHRASDPTPCRVDHQAVSRQRHHRP